MQTIKRTFTECNGPNSVGFTGSAFYLMRETDIVGIALAIHIKTPVFNAVPGYDRSSVVNRHIAIA
jgi:hypothetical protein